MSVPYTFATATSSIPLSQLDSNFATAITLGNTAVYLGNTTTSIGNLTVTNVTISSVASTFPNSFLANSSVTLGSTSVSLGATTTSLVGLSNVSSTVLTTPTLNSTTTLSLQTGGTTAVTVDASQNVGIGTTTTAPTNGKALTIYASDFPRLQMRNSTTGDTAGDGTVFYGSGLDFYIYNQEAGSLNFQTNGSTRATIDSSGNVLIGTTTASGKLVNSVGASQVGYYTNKPSSGNADHQQFYTDGTLFAKMTNRGSWYNFDNVYGSLSDETLKENIEDATSKLDDLMQVKVRNYNFIADDSKTKQLGVIAQEVEQIFPSMVDVDSDGLKSVKYSVFVPMLLKAIQELNAKVTALEAQLGAK